MSTNTTMLAYPDMPAKRPGIKYQNSILETIGNTPLIKMHRLNKGLRPLMLGKMEFFNPGGSSKDRIGIRMIEAAERLGLLRPGGTIVEPTSGNTGIGLAQAAVVKGYKVIFTMNAKVCQEKRNILKGYGAEIVVCPCGVDPDDPRSYYKVAERLTEEIPNSFSPNQYANENNPMAHYETTAPEIWRDTNGQITHFVAGMGTGGTITGTARYLKERNPAIKIIGIDAQGSLYRHLYDGTNGIAKAYKIEGIGQDFLPDTIDLALIDEIITISDKEAYAMARQAAQKEAWMVGSSAGAVIAGALKAGRQLDENAVMVLLLPDSGKNYLSTIFNDHWMEENALVEGAGKVCGTQEL
ncbi:MAG: pyridoxal-phosphate dependent enzyme [Saprospiraceae bacterium]